MMRPRSLARTGATTPAADCGPSTFQRVVGVLAGGYTGYLTQDSAGSRALAGAIFATAGWWEPFAVCGILLGAEIMKK